MQSYLSLNVRTLHDILITESYYLITLVQSFPASNTVTSPPNCFAAAIVLYVKGMTLSLLCSAITSELAFRHSECKLGNYMDR